ncbi:MAG TPA: mechanosensitive ion channel family protein [Ignavibacteriaceae bacterium]|nr:mechanosensitive ion channel family protein [Ignavibacteriaceae bacterium]
MEQFAKWLENTFDISRDLQGKILATLITIAILWLVRKIVLYFIFHRSNDIKVQYRWRKTSSYIAFTIGFLLVGRIWFEGFQAVATFFGLLSAGLAIALKDPLVDLAGWAFILWRKPFEVGDRIQMGETSGDVIDIRIFQFSLMEIGNWVDADQSTGRIINIPNEKVFTEVQANFSKGFNHIWNEIPMLVTFESNWKKAKEILGNIVNKNAEQLSAGAEEKIKAASKKFMIFYTKLTPIVYTSVRDCGVLLTIRYLCDPKKRRISEQAMWEDILNEFSKCSDIDFAYPTQRFYNNLSEGKPGSKA